MFAYSYMFARMYSRLADNEHVVSLSIDPTGTRMLLAVLQRRGLQYEGLFSEDEVDALKRACNPQLSWGAFFELLQKAFAEHTLEFTPHSCSSSSSNGGGDRGGGSSTSGGCGTLSVTLKHERQSDQVPVPPFTASIPVGVSLVSRPETFTKMCESMISFISLRTGDKSELERVENIIKVEVAIKEEAAVLNQELDGITGEMKMLEERTANARRDEEELAAQMNRRFGAGGWEKQVGNRTHQELMVCRARDPLRTDAPIAFPSLPLDMQLLPLIKSRHLTPSSVPASAFRHHNVVAPLPREDAESAIAALTSGCQARKDFWHALEQAREWEFDVAHFASVCAALPATREGVGEAGALVMLGYDLFYTLHLHGEFNISETTLISWLSMVERSYDPQVPFHNALHAADVLQALRFLLLSAGAVERFSLPPTTRLAMFIAACIVDFSHDGLTNSFHIASCSPLAILYANQSPQERRHVGSAMELMQLPRYNLFDGLSPAQRDEVEGTVLALVLATDLAHHEEIVAHFRQRFIEGSDFTTVEDQILAAKALFKAADVGFCARPIDLYLQWAAKLQQEFLRQGEREVEAGLAVSAFMGPEVDVSLAMKARLQLMLLNVVALPLLALLAEYLPHLKLLGDYSAVNRNHWANAEAHE